MAMRYSSLNESVKAAALMQAALEALAVEQVGVLRVRIPLIAPLGLPLDKRSYMQEIWDTFVKPEQEMEIPQSAEMRALMAVLRAVYSALPEEVDDDGS
jgi:hypothetical protein